MEATAQREVNLRRDTSKALKKAGYNVTPRELNPNDQSPLEGITEVLGAGAHIVGSEVEEKFSGKGPQTHIGVTKLKGGSIARWVLGRSRRKEK